MTEEEAIGSPNSQQDPENGQKTELGRTTTDLKDSRTKVIQHAFIRKVYCLLLVQLMIAISLSLLFTFESNTRRFAKDWKHTYTVYFMVLAISFVVSCCILCCYSTIARKAPANLILLTCFSICYGFISGFVCTSFATDAVLLALGLTIIVCFLLAIFSFQTKIDFTGYTIYVIFFLCTFVIFGLIFLFYPYSRTRKLVYSFFGVLLFSFFLVYDTQLMIGGEHKYFFSREDYVLAALLLLMDIVNLFIYLLRIITGDGSTGSG